MMTSTVAPLWPPLNAARSFDNLCALSARDNPAASKAIRVKSASRAPQVVVFRTLSLEGRFVSGLEGMSWAPN